MIIVTIYLCYFLVFLHIEMPSFNVYKKKLVDTPRYLDANIWKYIFVLGKSKWKSNFARLAKITKTAIKKWIFFCFRTGQNICRHRHNLSVPFCIWRGERKTRVKIGLLYFFSFSQIAPNLKWKKGMAGLENLSMRMWWWCHFLEIYVWHIINSLFLLLLLIYTLW